MRISSAHDGGCTVVRLAGRLDGESGEQLFTHQHVCAVIHLLSDDRGGTGAGESQLRRKLCSTAPVTAVVPSE